MQGEYFKIVENYKKKTAYLVFSAMSTPAGTFQMGKALAKLPGLLIYLNDKDNNWYQHGVPGVGLNTAETIESLKSQLKSEQIEQIICIGASMGGYGAALYGELLGADLVICFSSEMQLGIPFSRSNLHSTVDTSIESHNLANTIGKNNKTKYIFFVGTSDIIDLYNASLIAHNSFTFYLLKNKNHFLTQDLHLEFTLEKILSDAIHEIPFTNDSWLDSNIDLVRDASEIESLYDLYVSLRRRDFEQSSRLISKIVQLNNSELCNLFTGMYWSRQKDYEKSEQMLETAVTQNRLNRDSLFELAIVKRALGKIEESIALYKSVLEVDPSYAPALNHLGMIHEKSGSLNDAEECFKNAFALKGEDLYKKNLIKILEKNINDKQSQIEKLLANQQ